MAHLRKSVSVGKSESQKVNESESSVILEIPKVGPVITESVKVDRIQVYDNGHRAKNTNRVTFVLLEVVDLQSLLKN